MRHPVPGAPLCPTCKAPTECPAHYRETLLQLAGTVEYLDAEGMKAVEERDRLRKLVKTESGAEAEALNNALVEIENKLAAASLSLSEPFVEDMRFLLQKIQELRDARSAAHARAERHKQESEQLRETFLRHNQIPNVKPDPDHISFAVGSGLKNGDVSFVIGQIMYVQLQGNVRALAIYDLEGKVRLAYKLVALPTASKPVTKDRRPNAP